MKKFIIATKIVLALALILALIAALSSDIFRISLTAPNYQPDENPSTPPDDPGSTPGDDIPERPGTSAPPDENIPNWTIKPTVVKNSLTDNNGNILCESRYSYPYVTSNDGSDVSAFADALDKINSEIKDYVNGRVQLYKLGTSDDFKVPPQITGYYTINRFSSELFSISFIFSEIMPDGAIREERMNYTLDILLNSSSVTLDAIMNDAVSAVNGMISAKKEDGKLPALYGNYEKLVESTINSSWSVHSDGILFFFPAGTIAPTSSGPIEVFINGSALSSLLSEYGKILLNITK